MHKLLISFLVTLSTLVFTSTVYARRPIPPMPEKCPSINSIQATQFLTVGPIPDQAGKQTGKYVALQLGKYDTTQSWSFVLYFPANSDEEARDLAESALTSLAPKSGPYYSQAAEVWACLYQSNPQYTAISITPVSNILSVNSTALSKAETIR